MKAVRAGLVSPRTFDLVEFDLRPGPRQVLVEIAACGICSSEIPRFDGTLFKDPPMFMGHEASGVVTEVGADVNEFKPGDRVTGEINPGFATHAIASPDRLVRVPATIPLDHALGEPLMCTTNVARAAAPQFGDFVAVVGCGAMGLLSIAALRSPSLGALVAVDQIQFRLETARACGATHTINSSTENAVEALTAITAAGADVVIEFTGSPAGLELAAALLRPGQGKLVMAGYHHSTAAYNLRGFAHKGLIAHSPHPAYSPDLMADYRRGMAALERGVFPMERIVTHRFPFERIAEGFESLIARRPGYLKGVVVKS